MSKPRFVPVVDVSSDSESGEEYWDASEDEEYLNAAYELANNSPCKNDTSLPKPCTPSTSRIAVDLQERLNMESGSPRSNTTARTAITPSSQHLHRSPSRARTDQGTRRIAEFSPSRSKSSSTSGADRTPTQGIPSSSNSQARSNPSLATGSPRSSRINKAWERLKTTKDGHLRSRAGPMGPPEANRTSGTASGINFPPSKPMTSAGPRPRLPYDSDYSDDQDDQDVEMNEVENLVDTDTESSEPSTRQSSLLFPDSGNTSMTSVQSDVSAPLSSRKRSIDDHPDGSPSDSCPPTPPKIRRTTDDPQRMRPLNTLAVSRAATYPNTSGTSQRIYSSLDEESVFRVPSKVGSGSPLLSQTSGSSSTSDTSMPLEARITPPVSPSKPLPATHFRQSQGQTQGGPSGVISSEDIFNFLDTAQGDNLPYHFIAHDDDKQAIMDAKHLSRGVQFEIARGVSQGNWIWSDVTTQRLGLLEGTNADAAWKVAHVMHSRNLPSVPHGNMELWRELDREIKATSEGKGRGLGLMGNWEGVENWYGGRIQQIAHLVKTAPGEAQPYKIILEKLESTRSHRFARYLGSLGVLQLGIPKDLVNRERDDVIVFLSRNFVLCGRIYRPFTSKEGKVYLMEIDENYKRCPDPAQGDQHRVSFSQFINWHNPFHLNCNQPMSKWTTRQALGLSTSRPILQFEEENIFDLADLPLHDPLQGKLPTEAILTDGCGLINGAALTLISNSDVVRLSHRPVAVQGRIAGSKGMWVLHPEDQSPTAPPRIWIRPSQRKINLPRPLHRAHCILDLVCPSRVSIPSRLSMQTVINLSHNGVPDNSFDSLIKKELEALIEPLTQWNDPHAMFAVAKAVEQAGHITGSRLQRVAGGSTKALGLSRDFHRDEADADRYGGDDGDDILPGADQIYSGRDLGSGAPLSLFENAYEMILAGFHPLTFPPLYEKMQKIVTNVIDACVKSFHIPVSESVEAFIIPDPKGVLEEGEIYFHSSKNLSDNETGAIFNTITGEVIVGRNPTRLPSDMQKVTAVNHPALSEWYDVIIFSTKGERSLASLLGGGDYDGDTVMLFWSRLLVEFFQTSAFNAAPADLSLNFHKQVESVTEFGKRVFSSPASKTQEDFQKILLLGLMDTKVGLYSCFHDNAVYQHGYGDPRTVRLAYMFTTCLDSAKTGLRLTKDAFKEDQKQYGGSRASCMVPADKPEYADSGYQNYSPERSRSLDTFILDNLVATGEALRKKHLRAYDTLRERLDQRPDRDLMRPQDEAHKKAKEIKQRGFSEFVKELELIKAHVEKVRESHRTFWVPSRKSKDSEKQKPPDFARQFAEGPSEDLIFFTGAEVDAIKASYAYSLPGNSSNFALSVAFRNLCTIKAFASEHLPITRSFAETMSIGSSFLRVLGERGDE